MKSIALRRRALLGLTSGLFGLLSMVPLAAHAAFPDKPIKILVPWPPGGATDQVARILVQPLTQALGVSVFVENKGGAGGNIGTQAFVKEKADGHTLLLATSSTNAAGVHLYANQGFDPVKDFTPVILLCNIPNIMAVPANSPWNTLGELMAAAKKAPGKHTYGSAGIGSSQHLAGAQFKTATGLDINHVPYKGSGPAAVDLMAGHIDMMIDTGSLTNIAGGKLKALAVASKKTHRGLAPGADHGRGGRAGVGLGLVRHHAAGQRADRGGGATQQRNCQGAQRPRHPHALAKCGCGSRRRLCRRVLAFRAVRDQAL